jgi:putative ABC transport system permease protein
MIFEDVIRHAWRAITGHRQRSLLTMLGITIGIASVILLTSIGEGTRLYMLTEFTQFGTNLVAVNPGRSETSGMPGALGGTVNPLTIEDMEAVGRLPGVEDVVPVVMGTAPVIYQGRERNVFVYGVTSNAPKVWSFGVRMGRFLPESDPRHGAPLVVLGPTLKRELFGEGNALGEHVRISGQRFVVVGIMESKGQFLGIDIDDSAYIPVSVAWPLFNKDDLQEIDVLVTNASVMDSVAARMERLLRDRHNGELDFTITTQTGMLETMDRIIRIVSGAIVGIGAISLLVGAIGILTMMWISVNERIGEIGLAKAIGATPRQILYLYLAEAALISLSGGLLGLAFGMGLAQLIRFAVPALPVQTPVLYVGLALVVSLVVGLASGILPARRAAYMDPVEALAAE